MIREEQLKEIDIPKKPVHSREPRYGHGYDYYDWVCPVCGHFLAFEPAFYHIPNRCTSCGQLLKRMTRQEAESDEDRPYPSWSDIHV